jgi:hypothetical protein
LRATRKSFGRSGGRDRRSSRQLDSSRVDRPRAHTQCITCISSTLFPYILCVVCQPSVILWQFELTFLKSGLLCKASEDFSRRIFKRSNTDFIKFPFSESTRRFDSVVFVFQYKLCRSSFIYDVINSFYIWNCNIQEFTLESYPYLFLHSVFSHSLYIVQERSISQCETHR